MAGKNISNAGSSEILDDSELLLDIQDDDKKQLLKFLYCHKCSDLATDAVDTLCCHVLLCQACLDLLEKVCPDCGRSCSGSPNHLARRLIGCQPWRCRHCGAEGSRSDEADHRRLCPAQPRQCPAPGCQFAGAPDEFLAHLTERHAAQLLRKSALLFSARAAPERQGTVQPLSSRRLRMPGLMFSAAGLSRDPSRQPTSHTGKNYCVRPLNGPACDCCDGICGPNNGCNCCDCMRADLATFGLRPGEHALVNREGVIARVGQETGRFYCGRPNMAHDPATDGFCGPNNGNNCHACHQLDRQAQGRYADIVREWA
ncbi:hypothetical protein BOX15_Mlig003331g1 [Macrostomum lignano]|uniref:RING-type domain-containing protein n=1 Tax=Macrostomum lignano TaxID=282301 RepID=A0A267DQF7_9PLAT|nr:hypothetical protein BOX15_Mlig003331g1 [Macrostomum lignano]